MTGENSLGAAIAALICLLSGVVTLLSQEGVSGVGDISEAAWVVLLSGSLVSFLKDYQSLAVRRWSASAILKTETAYPKERFPRAYHPTEIREEIKEEGRVEGQTQAKETIISDIEDTLPAKPGSP